MQEHKTNFMAHVRVRDGVGSEKSIKEAIDKISISIMLPVKKKP
jgi:hypothetical protein